VRVMNAARLSTPGKALLVGKLAMCMSPVIDELF
jgi:hypothetical protein